MDIKSAMESKWTEITAIKTEREALFENFDANKDRIAALYHEIDVKELQYMLLKRKQLAAAFSLDPEIVADIERVNETCIGLLTEKLVKNGQSKRLEQEGIINCV